MNCKVQMLFFSALLITMEKPEASVGLAEKEPWEVRRKLQEFVGNEGAYSTREMRVQAIKTMADKLAKAIDLEAEGILFSKQWSSREWIFEN